MSQLCDWKRAHMYVLEYHGKRSDWKRAHTAARSECRATHTYALAIAIPPMGYRPHTTASTARSTAGTRAQESPLPCLRACWLGYEAEPAPGVRAGPRTHVDLASYQRYLGKHKSQHRSVSDDGTITKEEEQQKISARRLPNGSPTSVLSALAEA
jgi:hypothetical protein